MDRSTGEGKRVCEGSLQVPLEGMDRLHVEGGAEPGEGPGPLTEAPSRHRRPPDPGPPPHCPTPEVLFSPTPPGKQRPLEVCRAQLTNAQQTCDGFYLPVCSSGEGGQRTRLSGLSRGSARARRTSCASAGAPGPEGALQGSHCGLQRSTQVTPPSFPGTCESS